MAEGIDSRAADIVEIPLPHGAKRRLTCLNCTPTTKAALI
jgi:hypothetical protein